MGNKSSRQLLSYEEAVKLLTPDEFERVQSWYKRCTGTASTSSDGISLRAFTHEILSDDAPDDFAKALYEAFGASLNGGSTNRGLNFKDLICALAVVTKGSREDRVRFLFNYFSSDGEYIYADEFYKQIAAFEQGRVPSVAYELFRGLSSDGTRANLEQFLRWVCTHQRALSITDWLLSDPPKLSLTVSKNFSNIPTFFSTLAGVTHLQEKDIEEIEKQFKILVDARFGKLTLERFRLCVHPPLPECLVEGIFRAFDDNCDSQIDFKELVCGVSECCRAPPPSRLLFCLKSFDIDRDGFLSTDELETMFEQLLLVKAEISPRNLATDDPQMLDINALVQSIRAAHNNAEKIPLREVAIWLDPHRLADDLLTLLFQICHVVFGLSPRSKREEEGIVRGWLEREQRRGYAEGQTWYLISKRWWRQWENWMDFVEDEVAPTSHQPTANGAATAYLKKTGSLTSVCAENLVADNSDRSLLISSVANQVVQSRADAAGGGEQCYMNGGQTKVNSVSRTSSKSSGGRSWSPCPRVHSNAVSSAVFYSEYESSTVERPSAIDNACLLVGKDGVHSKLVSLTNEGGILKGNELLSTSYQDFQVVPEALWFALTRWYKGGSPALPRTVIQCPETNRLELELFPIQLILLRHQQNSTANGLLAGATQRYHHPAGSNYSSVAGSLVSGISTYTMNAANAAMSALNYWSHAPRRVPSYTATFSRLTPVCDVFAFLCRQLRLNQDTARLWVYAPDENNLVQLEEERVTLGDLERRVRHSATSTGGLSFVGERKLSSSGGQLQILIEVRNADLTWPEEISGLAKSRQSQSISDSKAGSSSGRIGTSDTITAGTVVERGLTGLNNLGNTCFMNSALQCVSNTKPLTQYFLRNMHLYELNRTNSLGKKGQMALQYANLVRELWSGKFRVVAPLKLRCTVCKYASQFNDFQQHDSQELLSFLVDGLHEDLNRVHRKPYTELKDSDGRPDDIVAAEAWDNHIKRNQSIVVDLLHGLLKSQVTCKQCKMTSVRFDPFTFLSLPLPLENCVFLQIIVIRLDGSTPVKYGLRLLADDRFEAIKEKLREYTGLPCDRLLIVQLSGNNLIQSILSDRSRVKPYANWTLYAYETPPPSAGQSKSMLTVESCVNSRISSADHVGDTSSVGGCLGNGVVPQVHHPANRGVNGNKERFMPAHSRSPSNVSSASSGGNLDLGNGANGDCFLGFTVAIQRRMEQRDSYVAAHNRYRCHNFSLPIIVPADIDERTWSGRHIYEMVYSQLARFLSANNSIKPANNNHAINGDHRPGEYPFTLCMVQRQGAQRCARCPWYECCSGCPISPNSDDRYALLDCFIAVDWDPTELHLRYQPSAELTFMEHCSVKESYEAQMEPVSLDSCLRAFTTPEELKDNDTYYCGKCKAHCPASKKLDIWKLPPVLIFHFKRFQCINETRWVKSCKTVTFPIDAFDPSQYLAPQPMADPISLNISVCGNDSVNVSYEGRGELECVNAVKVGNNIEMETRCVAKPSGDGNEEETRLMSLKCGQHDHRLKQEYVQVGDGDHLQYDLYAIVCHAGMLGAGHYVAYVRHGNGKWYLYNDSSCKEVSAKDIDYSLAYILFYERRGLDYDRYIPDVSGRQVQDVEKVDEECEADVKRLCVIQ